MARRQTSKFGHTVRKKLGGPPARRETISFVITLWLEPSAEPEWRWRVTCVQTGEQRLFHHLQDFLTFVSTEADVPAPR